ncbi:hypothetical protein HDU85_002415 [Gaertneriomyces sp. JEL0708]|nr:hypothetical protein HDU85_002415 [Gaertneriomyces sp. JEL0708]
MDPPFLPLPNYTPTEIIHYNARTGLIIQRARLTSDTSQSVICKATTFFDEEENDKIRHEFAVLELIHETVREIKLLKGKTPNAAAGGKHQPQLAMKTVNEDIESVPIHIRREDIVANLHSPEAAGLKVEPPKIIRQRLANSGLSRLEGIDERIIKPLRVEEVGGQLMLVLEDCGGVSLREFVEGATVKKDVFWNSRVADAMTGSENSLADIDGVARKPAVRRTTLEDFLCIALQLSECLEIIHAAQVIHKDINPDNIVIKYNNFSPQVRPSDPTAAAHSRLSIQLIDFNLAEVTDMGTQTIQRNYLEGTLSYLSPEQTGRMGRLVDYRTDFYSLGVTLWELLVGRRCFVFDDATEYVHAHLAKEIESPHVHDPIIPHSFCAIIQKLVSKSPEARYQSASGLRYDIQCLLSHLYKHSKTHPTPLSDAVVSDLFRDWEFSPGARDFSHRLNVPDKLYGREDEMAILTKALDEVVSGRNRSELVVVCGKGGEGKSSLVGWARKIVLEKRGYFVTGRYNDFNKNKPYGGLVEGLQQLVRQILTESDDSLERWQNTLRAKLGPDNLALVIDVVPELELLVGRQPVNELGIDPTFARETQFITALQTLIGAFAQPEHPLAVFLEDLQFAEPTSERLLQASLFDRNLNYFMVIATWRSNDSQPKFGPTVMRLKKESPNRLLKIHLSPMSHAALKEMLTETLVPAADDVDALASMIYKKTLGNPLHVREFLRYAHHVGLIYMNETAGGWTWDIHEMDRQTVLSENVAELLLSRLRQFPQETQILLQQAACIGDRFDLQLLASLAGQTIIPVATALWTAVKEGFILPQTDNAQRVRRAISSSGSSSGSLGSQNMRPAGGRSSLSLNKSIGGMVMAYRFCHARLHHACYEMMTKDERKVQHLHIARLMRRHPPDDQRDFVFSLVTQYDEALEMIQEDDEKVFVASLYLEAATRHKKIGALKAARQTLKNALRLVEGIANVWDNQFELLFNLNRLLAEIFIGEREYDSAADILKSLESKRHSTHHQTVAGYLLVGLYHIQGRFQEVIDLCYKELKRVNVPIPRDESEAEEMVINELKQLESLLGDKRVEEVISSVRELDARDQQLHMLLICAAGAHNVMTGGNLAQYFYAKGCVLSLSRGFSHRSLEHFAFIARTYASNQHGPPNFSRMRWIIQLVYKLVERAPLDAQARGRLGIGAGGMIYLVTLREFTQNIEKCISAAAEAGHHAIAIYAIWLHHNALFSYGQPMGAIKEWERKYQSFIEGFPGYFTTLWDDAIAELQATASGVRTSLAVPDKVALSAVGAGVNFIYQLMSAVIYDRSEKRQMLMKAQSAVHQGGFVGSLRYIDVMLCQGLIAASEYNSAPEERKPGLMAEIDEAYNSLKLYLDQEPYELMTKIYLVGAERERVLGNQNEARHLYEQALDAAHNSGFRMHEALATELYACFWLSVGSTRLARACFHDAYALWRAWGSEGKCKDILRRHGRIVDVHLLTKSALGSRTNGGTGTQARNSSTGQGSSAIDLDLTTVLKVSQTFSNETSLEILLTKVIKFVMENAGAKKGLLILQQAGKLFIEALGLVDEAGEHHQVLQHIPMDQAASVQGGPLSVLYYVYRTREALVLADAAADEVYGKDPYIASRHTKSILCCPIMHQNTITGVAYMENDLEGVFTRDRTELIQGLMAAASMSIDNAKLSKANTELTAALEHSSVPGPKYNLDGPIKKVIDSLQGFKVRLPPGDGGINEIDFIMKALTSGDFFSSNIDDLNDESGQGLDSDTKKWIESSLLQREPKPSRARSDAKEHMFATTNGDDSHGKPVRSPSETTVKPVKELHSLNMERVHSLLEKSTTFDFNIFELAEATNGRPLFYLGTYLLHKWGLMRHFALNEKKVRTFFDTIENAYHPLPYHNNIHGADVLQTVNLLLLSDSTMAANFTKLEIFAACTAAAIHDVDHPGLNNNFLVQSSHPLAIFYNDMSVLEYHHAAKAFEVSLEAETNLFDGIPNDQYRELRKLIINMVVATDMSQHFTYINKLKGKIAASSMQWEEPGDRALILELAIKCADLNNSAKPLEQSTKWALQVMEDFFLQGDREKKMGMPVSKFMDRDDTSIPKCQLGFIDVLVVPLFDSWARAIETEFSAYCMENISRNRRHWEWILDHPEHLPPIPRPSNPVEVDLTVPVVPEFEHTKAIAHRRKSKLPVYTEEDSDSSQDTLTKRTKHIGSGDTKHRLSVGAPSAAKLSSQFPHGRTQSDPPPYLHQTPRVQSPEPPTAALVTQVPPRVRKSSSGGSLAGFLESRAGERDVASAPRGGGDGPRPLGSGRRRSSAGPGGKVVLPALPKSLPLDKVDAAEESSTFLGKKGGLIRK